VAAGRRGGGSGEGGQTRVTAGLRPGREGLRRLEGWRAARTAWLFRVGWQTPTQGASGCLWLLNGGLWPEVPAHLPASCPPSPLSSFSHYPALHPSIIIQKHPVSPSFHFNLAFNPTPPLSLCTGGVYIAGGIVPRLMDRVGALREAFLMRKGRERFQGILQVIGGIHGLGFRWGWCSGGRRACFVGARMTLCVGV
jgi:hypothetical protein